jgi:DNA (cytosine-5)-methyltransferase 1
VLVAILPDYADQFEWPEPSLEPPPTVGEALHQEMASAGWAGADDWRSIAKSIAPTLVGGSRLHGGPDLGPTRARQAWAKLGVEARTIAEQPPEPGFDGMPRLTVKMCAILQGFATDWEFVGRKTQSCRQVGNAFPPPVARAVGSAIRAALLGTTRGQPGS